MSDRLDDFALGAKVVTITGVVAFFLLGVIDLITRGLPDIPVDSFDRFASVVVISALGAAVAAVVLAIIYYVVAALGMGYRLALNWEPVHQRRCDHHLHNRYRREDGKRMMFKYCPICGWEDDGAIIVTVEELDL